jgi:hypothetical protein
LVPLSAYPQVTLTGAIEFSTNSSGADTGQVWNTLDTPACCYRFWLALNSDATSPVNGPSDAQASIDIPLTVGHTYHYYTYGAPGFVPRFAFAGLNLFFDGNNSTPGISVFGDTSRIRFEPDGSSTLTLEGSSVAGSGRSYYVSSGVVVVLTGYDWHLPSTPPGDVCQAYEFAPGGGVSFHGYIALHVAPAAALTIGPPSSGSPATGMTLRGSGFAPAERVTVYLGGLSFPALATTIADASGAFAITVAAQHSDEGPKDVYAVGQNSGKLGAASISVTPGLP